MPMSSISPVKIKAFAAAFVGLHVPLVGLAIYGLMTDFAAMLPVLLVALLSTLIGVAGTLYALFYIMDGAVASHHNMPLNRA